MKRILLFVLLSSVLLALWGCNEKQAARPFITKWQGKAGQELKIPILGTYTLTWYNEATPEDRHTEQVTITAYMGENGIEETTPYILIPPTDGIYVVEAGSEGVEGMLMSFENSFEYGHALLTVVQFGDVVWKRLHYAFSWCVNMRFAEGIDTPNLSQCTSLKGMFQWCKSFNSPLANWDVSKITNMNSMFETCENFNQPLESWDVSHVTDMSRMFAECSSFNQPLAKWNVSKVSDMSDMFHVCSAFNQDINDWNVSNVTKMGGMFCWCSSFNQPLEKWDVSKVRDMSDMFRSCKSFNQPLGKWDVSNVRSMRSMFWACTSFNQSLEAWKINPLAHSEGMQDMFVASPAAELPFVARWREAGCQLGDDDVFLPADDTNYNFIYESVENATKE